MNTPTLAIEPNNYGNIFFLSGDADESVNTSKAKGEFKVFQLCSRHMHRLTGMMSGSTSSAVSTGQRLVDPATEIQNAQSLTTLIAIARAWISGEIAESLSGIHDYPLEEDELPLDLTSVKNFLLYSFSKGLNRPILTATHDGLLQADWDSEEGNGTVAIRFLASDKAWVTSRTEEMRGTVEIKLSSLLKSVTPLNLPSWANE